MSKIKANCERCYYGGAFIPSEGLASCNCARITEPTEIRYDSLFKKERQYVERKKWDSPCDCEHFTPRLSEGRGDFELNIDISYETQFDCPFCGEELYVFGIGVDETKLVTCDQCRKRIAVEGKAI